MKSKFKQLPLDGNSSDFFTSLTLLKNSDKLKENIKNFYKDNEEINPVQLHYIIETLSMYTHLDILID